MNHFSPTRAAGVFILVGALLTTLLGRVCYLQTIGRQETVARADRQQHQSQVWPARRGGIYDRNGLLLAGTIQTDTLFIDPKFMQDFYQQDGHSLVEMDDAISKLAKILDKDMLELEQLLSDRSTSRFVKVAENLDDATAEQIFRLNLPGVGLQPTSVRYYPMGSIAAHILGGVGKDGRGLEGIELQYEKTLAGKNGWERTLKDARHRGISIAAEDYVPPQNGQHLVLTIDANIQMIAEQELDATCEKFKAKRGEVVVMDPHTGEVLAMANWPTFNPQNLSDSPDEVRRNRAVTDPYEPGSTFKPFIAGPALEWGVTRINEVWPVDAKTYKTPYGRTITDVHFYGPLATWDGLVKSSNILMSMLGERMGNARLFRALSLWNFGRQTGIELPGEDPGRVNPLRKWNTFSTESVSQGYEVMVTPLQICRAFCAYANGGYLVRPTLIKGTLDCGDQLATKIAPVSQTNDPRVLDESTVETMRQILCDVVVRGTATRARSEFWNLFGKTGTAHISEGKKGYSLTRFNSSFICAGPAENPRLVTAFIVHEPDPSIAHYGGTVSAPGAGQLMERALTYLQVPPSPELPPPPASVQGVLVNFDPKAYHSSRAVASTDAGF
jgi:cell division protein FtsI/penicillin-binding protein 2